jgi:hypothetical protein
MAEKRDRDPWDDRYGDDDEDIETSQTSETEESSKMQETSKTSKSSKTAKSKQTSKSTVRDRKNVNMYLPDDLVGDLQLRYSELNVDWRRKYDDDMPKNQEFYPAVIRAALEETTIREELDLD